MTMAFVAIKPGWPGYAAASVDEPGCNAGDDAATWLRQGYDVKRVDVEEARKGLCLFLDEKKKRRSETEQRALTFGEGG